MKFKIDKKIFEKFSGLKVGIIVVSNAENNGIKAVLIDREDNSEYKNKTYSLDELEYCLN